MVGLALEALQGTEESFVPFLHDYIRPHPGQIEVAANIRRMVQGSQLVRAPGWSEDNVEVSNR